MSEKERNIAESLTRACELLPDGKKEYLIGYAEGVAAMAEKWDAGSSFWEELAIQKRALR